MRSLFKFVVVLSSLVIVAACDQGNRRQGAIYLPEGDAARGEEHFVSLGCVSCHSIVGSELADPAEEGPVRVRLGSRTSLTMSYDQLITSIVNPSHRLSPRYRKDEVSEDGESLMNSLNDRMTVAQLTDLVAFLQTYYVKAERPRYRFPVYDFDSADKTEAPVPE